MLSYWYVLLGFHIRRSFLVGAGTIGFQASLFGYHFLYISFYLRFPFFFLIDIFPEEDTNGYRSCGGVMVVLPTKSGGVFIRIRLVV